MKTIKSCIFLFLTTFSILALSTDDPLKLDTNVLQPSKHILVGGQPTEQDIEKLKAAGVTTIINLRTDKEDIGFDEASFVKQQGMNYIHIPVAGVKGITQENAIKLDQALKGNSGKTFIHCRSGNRVGGLFALRDYYLLNKNLEEAIQTGNSHGLTGLTSDVKTILSKEASNPKLKETSQ